MPDPQNYNIRGIIGDIERGLTKIPQFQRDFIWSKDKAAKLIDSIVKGYPIGTFIFWKTKESLRYVRNIGDIHLPETPNGDYTQYVLDGQQRITSIFASILGKKVKCSNSIIDFSEIYIDLNASEDEDIVIADKEDRKEEDIIKITTLLFGGLAVLSKYKAIHHEKLDRYKSRIEIYPIPVILVRDVPIDVATEIFTRINVGGKPLTIFEIMVAKTFDLEKGFDLSREYDKLMERLGKVNYETISEAVLLRAISVMLIKECKKKQILNLDKNALISIYPKVVDAISEAVDYFRLTYNIPASELLPYQDLLVLFSYFFFVHPVKPFGEKSDYLRDLFWRISLTERYTSGTENKIAQDIKRIELISNSTLPQYDYSPAISIRPEHIERDGTFNVGHSYIKAILCLFMEQQPRSFADNSLISIGNDALRKGNSKNYHHFFPKSYLGQTEIAKHKINHISNIVVIDDYLNKRIIGSKSPSEYMRGFQNNPHLKETMATHMIDLDTFGIWENDYETFFRLRTERISDELARRVILTDEPQPTIPQEHEIEIFFKNKDVEARGIRKRPGVLVLKYSLASISLSDSITPYIIPLREKLLRDGILIKNSEHLVFENDYLFDSPSTAATLICGSNRNGMISWKDSNGRTLKDIEGS